MKTSSILSVAACLLLPFQAMGQEPGHSQEQWKTQCGTPTGQGRFPVESYEELPQFVKPDANDWEHVKGTCLSWGRQMSGMQRRQYRCPGQADCRG